MDPPPVNLKRRQVLGKGENRAGLRSGKFMSKLLRRLLFQIFLSAISCRLSRLSPRLQQQVLPYPKGTSTVPAQTKADTPVFSDVLKVLPFTPIFSGWRISGFLLGGLMAPIVPSSR